MTTNAGTISQSNNRAFRNPWVIAWIALVVIVLAVNIAMITLAVTTNPGLVDKDYYENLTPADVDKILERLQRS